MAHDEHDQGEAKEQESSSTVGRRSVLQILGTTFAACTLSELEGCAPNAAEVGGAGDDSDMNDEELTVSSYVEAVRARDLLSLTIGLSNLRRTINGTLTRIAPGDAYIVLVFPPQAILEEALPHAPSNPPKWASFGNHIAAARMGGPSRLAFLMPKSFTAIPYTLDAILTQCMESQIKLPGVTAGALRIASENVPPVAPATLGLHPFAAAAIDRATASVDPQASQRLAQRAHAVGDGAAPMPMEITQGLTGNAGATPWANDVTTFVEMPFRVLLSPTGDAAFSHSATVPTDITQTVELWHSKLCGRDPVTGKADSRLAAPSGAGILGVRDTQLGQTQQGSLDPVLNPSVFAWQRGQLAAQSNYSNGASNIELRRMMLSTLGGSLDLHAEFPGQSIASWTHRMSWGRETFVEVTQLGYLLPFGNRAIRLDLSRRNDDPRVAPVGTLLRWTVVIVKNPIVRFGGYPSVADGADYLRRNDFPFGAIELKRTSFVMDGIPPTPAGCPTNSAWLTNFGDAGPFPIVGYDQGGNPIRLEVPLFFFPSITGGAEASGCVNEVNAHLPIINMQSQSIKYAGSNLTDTTWATGNVNLKLSALHAPETGAFTAAPYFDSADLTVESVRRVTGQGVTTYRFHPKFKSVGIDPAANRSQVMLQPVVNASTGAVGTINMTVSNDSQTGFVRPNMSFNAVSRTNGPIFESVAPAARMALMDLPSDQYLPFKPADYFANAGQAADVIKKTLLFGSVPLLSVLKEVLPGDLANDLVKDPMRFAPKFISDAFSDVEKFIAALHGIEQQVSTLEAQAREQLDKLTNLDGLEAAVKDRIKTEVDGIKTDVNSLRDAILRDKTGLWATVQTVINDITNITSSISDFKKFTDALNSLAADIDQVFIALDGDPKDPARVCVLPAVQKLIDRIPSQDLKSAAARPGTIIDGVKRDFDKAVETFKVYQGKAADVVNLFKAMQKGFDTIREQTLRLEWRPKLQNQDFKDLPIPIGFHTHSDQALCLSVEARAKAKGDKPAGVDFSARLDRFDLLLGAITEPDAALTLKFKYLEVKQLAGHKPDVDVKLDNIHFGGPLSFIQTLTDILPRDGFSDPPFLTIDGDGIHAGFTLAIPDLAVGVFAIMNMNIKAELVIPLIGQTPIKFAFNYCSKDAPFLVTVALLGGGGYFRMEIDTAGNVIVEGSICVAAAVAINLGVASASVSITAGIFFSFGGADSKLGGFLCLHGQCNVLGLITISIDLRLELWWEPNTGDVVGRATLTVEIDIAFFSVTVSLEFEKRFGGASSSKSSVSTNTFMLDAPTKGTTLREVMCENPALPESTRYEDWAWKEYVCAFA